MSTVAALSLVAGVINATFKIDAGCRQCRRGPLDTIGLADRTIKCASLLPVALAKTHTSKRIMLHALYVYRIARCQMH